MASRFQGTCHSFPPTSLSFVPSDPLPAHFSLVCVLVSFITARQQQEGKEAGRRTENRLERLLLGYFPAWLCSVDSLSMQLSLSPGSHSRSLCMSKVASLGASLARPAL